MNKQKYYEEEKKKIQLMNLTPKEYEKKIKELCEKINY